MIARNLQVARDLQGKVKLSLDLTNASDLNAITDLFNIDLDITIKPYKKKRTVTSNAYLWVLCDKLASKIQSTKENVYRLAIKQVGTFEIVPVKNEAVTTWSKNWESKGEGWVCEELRESKLQGYTTMTCYYGSSTYDTLEFKRLVDYIVEECKEQGIETMTPDEIMRLRRL